MRDAILVAPAGAQWPDAARAALRSAGVHVVKLTDLGMVGLLLMAGDVELVIVDHQNITAPWRAHLAELTGLSPQTRLIVVRDGSESTEDATPWPADEGTVAELLGLRPTGPVGTLRPGDEHLRGR